MGYGRVTQQHTSQLDPLSSLLHRCRNGELETGYNEGERSKNDSCKDHTADGRSTRSDVLLTWIAAGLTGPHRRPYVSIESAYEEAYARMSAPCRCQVTVTVTGRAGRMSTDADDRGLRSS